MKDAPPLSLLAKWKSATVHFQSLFLTFATTRTPSPQTLELRSATFPSSREHSLPLCLPHLSSTLERAHKTIMGGNPEQGSSCSSTRTGTIFKVFPYFLCCLTVGRCWVKCLSNMRLPWLSVKKNARQGHPTFLKAAVAQQITSGNCTFLRKN